jgi:amidohydrolase
MTSTILRLAEKHYPSALRLRRYLHRHPELSFEETGTAERLREQLGQLGLRVGRSIAGTGFTALLKGGRKGRVAAFRADMDAIAVTERTGLPFESEHSGKMHACGHDVHMSIAVGIAAMLSELGPDLKGAVKFIFQPAEECPPGGAAAMIDGGALRSPAVDAIFALHVDPLIPAGKIGIRDGVMMAGVLDFDLELKGQGGHAAQPHRCVDTIVVAANLVGQLQNIISRHTDPQEPGVLTFGTIKGGSVRNAIADRVVLEGTMRSMSRTTMTRMRRRLERMCKHVTQASSASYGIKYFAGYPRLKNDRTVNGFIRRAAQELFGKRSVVELDTPIMGAEDFSRYLDEVPGAMFRLGIRNRKIGAVYPWHHSKFMADESAIEAGMAVGAKALIDFLEKTGGRGRGSSIPRG